MKRGALILILAVAGALAAYGLYYTWATAEARAMAASPHGELEWLRAEFALTDMQFTQIEALHRKHAARCEELCRRLDASHAEFERLIAVSDSISPELEAALAETASREIECRKGMLNHIYNVSARMSPENGARFIRMMKAHVVHSGLADHMHLMQQKPHGS